jgi:hypothetical protein
VDLTDFTILAASFNHGLDYPPEGVQLAATIDTTDPLDYQARLWWSPVANAATYTLDFSIDGASNFDTVDTQSTDYAAYLDGFDTMVPGECNYIRVNALDSTGATIARSNFVKLILPEGQQAARPSDNTGPAATQQMPTTQSVQKLLLALNGAFPPTGNVLDPIGNQWFEKMVEDTGFSVNSNFPTTYQDNRPRQGVADLLSKIDADGNKRITAAEEQAVDVIIAGYSWGSIAAVNVARELTGGRVSVPGSVYTLDAPIPISLLITIDPVRNGPFGIARLLKPVHGRVKNNVGRFVNYYQTRGGSTNFALYLPQSSGNGDFFPPIYYEGQEEINVPFGGLKGSAIGSDAAATVEVNITNLVGRDATNVEYFKHPLDLDLYNLNNWFDADLFGNNVQHDTMPYFVRGGTASNFRADVNWTLEVANA